MPGRARHTTRGNNWLKNLFDFELKLSDRNLDPCATLPNARSDSEIECAATWSYNNLYGVNRDAVSPAQSY
jgi:hypothetical protein